VDCASWANVEEGIVGIGSTVRAALRAFDAQYLAGQRPPNESITSQMKSGDLTVCSCAGCPTAESACAQT
jgi:hypothetical protein